MSSEDSDKPKGEVSTLTGTIVLILAVVVLVPAIMWFGSSQIQNLGTVQDYCSEHGEALRAAFPGLEISEYTGMNGSISIGGDLATPSSKDAFLVEFERFLAQRPPPRPLHVVVALGGEEYIIGGFTFDPYWPRHP